MGELRYSILRQQLQSEIDKAKRLERIGKNKQAALHYMKASSIYRMIAYHSPNREKAEEMFHIASQYETLGKTIKDTSAVRCVSDVSPGIQEEMIDNLIVSQKPETSWESIGGLEQAKKTIKEAIILPFIKSKPPYIKAPRTILLYGPPGTGKTLLAKASSNTLNATFFEARLPTLLSKYFGESPKLVSALFNKAKKLQPSLIFIDELDSIAMSRDSNIDESTRRVLSQLLTEIEGFNTSKEEKILIMGATNKPWDLDEALVSRFQKKIYVPLPDFNARKDVFEIHLKGADTNRIDLNNLSKRTEGFSGRDISSLCQEAIIHMVREQNPFLEQLSAKELETYSLNYRALTPEDFEFAFEKIKPSTMAINIKKYEEWKQEFGG
jgi:SpoVK/Ycf46/Vps4 family AAA+-type ATPase